jgi:hypothetical protein
MATIRSLLQRASPLVLVALVVPTLAAADPPVVRGASVDAASGPGLLPTLRGVMPKPDDSSRAAHEIPVRPVPLIDGPGTPNDSVVQGSTSPFVSTIPGLGVDGIGQGFTGPQGTFTVNAAPPDTNGAVGATQYVQIVNTAFAVFDKATKNVVYGPVPVKTLWHGFGGACEADNDGDPVVVYDKAANRWVISQFAVTATPYFQCVAVSTSSDATGGYVRYAFNYGNIFPDYPKMGVWPDAYYITFNMFTNTFQGAKLCAYDRASMLAGLPATQQCFQLSASFGGVLPADLDGATAPPAGAPNYMLNRGASTLNLWKFHVNWANSAASTLTGPIGIAIAPYTAACSGGNCIPQSGTRQQLDSLADRLMFRLAYRNFGDHESLVVNHSVQPGNKRNGSSGVRWYEVRNPGGTPTVFQQSTFAPDATFRWMGSIAMDKLGNMALGYSASSDTMHPAIRYTGRLAGDPLGTMQAETSLIEGTGSQLANLSRWGDYSAMTVDPVDDCTFWYTSEYLKANGTFNWSTRIASFKFSGCN